MKLDKLKFAKLVAFISSVVQRGHINNTDVEILDDMIDIEAPEVQHNYPATSDINMLMHLLYEGKQKIEAIKTYRKLTGLSLKESKDAVEQHWGLYDKLLARISQALGTDAEGDDLIQVAKSYRYLAEQHAADDDKPATLDDILGKVTAERPPVNFDKFEG